MCQNESLKAVKSRELRGGILYTGCDCIKLNGLQDDCPRSLCQGSPACLLKGGPQCAPGKLAKERIRNAPVSVLKRDPNPFDKCSDEKKKAQDAAQQKQADPEPKPPISKAAGSSAECQDIFIVVQDTSSKGHDAKSGGQDSCSICGKGLPSGESGPMCSDCLQSATQGKKKVAGNDKCGVYLCLPIKKA